MIIDKLDYVLAIAETRNMTAAAKQLFISQPALSQQLSALEKELGVTLFERSQSPITLTEAGKHYIYAIQRRREQDRLLRNELKRIENRSKNVFHLGIGKTRGTTWLPKILPELYKVNPEIQIEIFEGTDEEQEKQLKEGSIDVGIISTSVLSNELEFEKIIVESMILIINNESPILKNNFRKSSPSAPIMISPELLNNEILILPTSGHGLHQLAESLLSKYKINPKHMILLNNSETIYRIVTDGFGFTLTLSTFFHNNFQLEKKPSCIAIDSNKINRAVGIAVNKNINLPDYARKFIDVIKDVITKMHTK